MMTVLKDEVSIVIEKAPEEDWNNVIVISANDATHYLLTNEDGSYNYLDEVSDNNWGKREHILSDGMELKLYVFNDQNKNVNVQIGWYYPEHKITVYDGCTIIYDGNNFRVA